MASAMIDYLAANPPKGFQSRPFYSHDGDFLTYYFEDSAHYAERIDEDLTVYRADADDREIGFKLKGVRCLLKLKDGVDFEIRDDQGDVLLHLLMVAGMLTTKDDKAASVYGGFARKTKKVRVRERELV